MPLNFIKDTQHPGTYFVTGMLGILGSVAMIPFTVTGVPYEQRKVGMWLFVGAVVLLAGQLIFGLRQ